MAEKVSPRRRLIFYAAMLIIFAAMALTPFWRGGRPKWHHASGAVWNTTYHITYLASEDLTDSISAIFRQVEMSLSPFNPNSVISRINSGASDSTDSFVDHVFEISQRVNRLSEGRFDPTVSPLINLWGFGYEHRNGPEPSQAQIDSALNLVGLPYCAVSQGRMTKKTPGTTFNFSAVTKGFGCDLIGQMLRRNGCGNFMVEIGGEMALGGHNSSGTPWRVQIDAPLEADVEHHAMRVVELTDCGVATSGNYRNFRTDSVGRTFGHTISPLDGRPYQTTILSATVVAPTCAEADALATACMASGAHDAVRMLSAIPDIKALIVTAQADTLSTTSIGGL